MPLSGEAVRIVCLLLPLAGFLECAVLDEPLLCEDRALLLEGSCSRKGKEVARTGRLGNDCWLIVPGAGTESRESAAASFFENGRRFRTTGCQKLHVTTVAHMFVEPVRTNNKECSKMVAGNCKTFGSKIDLAVWLDQGRYVTGIAQKILSHDYEMKMM